MAKKQEKEISALVADQLGIKLGACQEYCDTLHSYDIVDQDACLDVHLDESVVKITGHAYGETRKEYTIKITLEEVDLEPTT